MTTSSPHIVIIGGGTAGLLLAEKLSRNASINVHVLEAGANCIGHPETIEVQMYTQNLGSDRDWAFETVPQAGFKNRTTVQSSGKLLGGSSTINGGFYVAPSRAGSNAWSQLGNQTWTSDVLTKSCKDTIRSYQPDIGVCQSMGVNPSGEMDMSACNGPISVSAKLDPHPVTEAYFRAFKDLGYEPSSALFHNHSSNSLVLQYTEDPHTLKRCGADSAFGVPLAQRPNVAIITNAVVHRIILEGKSPNVRAKGVEFTASGRNQIILATKEVVLSAGALSSPKILELSGIGGAEMLQQHGIPVVIDNAQVGERLRNHVMAMVHCELNQDVPPAAGMTAMAFMPSQGVPGLVNALSQYKIGKGKEAKYEEIVRKIFMDPKEASACHFMGFVGVPNAVTFGVISTIPFSHGSVHISSREVDDKPRIDPAFLSHELDLEVLARHIQTAATFAAQPALKKFFKMDANDTPPAAYAVEGLEQSKEYVQENAMTTYHSCGTAAMLPKEDGGVVDEQLRVYGTENLRVIDASVIPLIPHGNPVATVYGVSNRAADLMLAEISA